MSAKNEKKKQSTEHQLLKYRQGPLEERKCTDCCCCLLYLMLLLPVLLLVGYEYQIYELNPTQIQQALSESPYGNPILSIYHSSTSIIISLAFAAALSLMLLLFSLVCTTVAPYVLVPLLPIALAVLPSLLLTKYLGLPAPTLLPEIQKVAMQSHSLLTLIVACALYIGLIFSLVTLCVKGCKYKSMTSILQISRACLWSNLHLLLSSFFLTALSLAIITINIVALTLTQKSALSLTIFDGMVFGGIVLVEMLWTHGVMEALSQFFFTSVAIFWYFENKQEQRGCFSIMCLSVGYCFKHIGTIVFGHILAYIPETLNSLLNRYEMNYRCCYHTCCIPHKMTFRNLTRYCFAQTILESSSFCQANKDTFSLRQRCRNMLPQLHMMGNFYITILKTFIIFVTLSLAYLLLAQSTPELFDSIPNLLAPLLVVLLGSLQITCHFLNAIGATGDIIVFMYTLDIEIQKRHFGQIQAYSCPYKVRQIIHEQQLQELESF